ncbi:MAG: YcbK family protein [Beijerinckiaceae bacterium]
MSIQFGMRRSAALCAILSCAAPALADGDGSASPLAFVRENAASTASVDRAATQEAKAVVAPAQRTGGGQGIVRQTPSVSIGCLKPELVSILRRASSHYRSEVTVTSGFRGGRGRSYHAKCMAADVQIAGVSPGALARYFRGQEGVGGVGTYGHTRSVHVDVAPRKFSWHGRSSRRIRVADASCPCCGGAQHGGRSAFVCERGVIAPEIKLGAQRA